MQHVPKGFHTVTPYLNLEDAAAFVRFAEAAFGARILHVGKTPDGTIQHAEISIEGSMIELSEARPEWPATRCALHVFVPDADAAHARAVAAGATSTYPPATHPYGERSGSVQDRWGNQWFLATQVDPVARNVANT